MKRFKINTIQGKEYLADKSQFNFETWGINFVSEAGRKMYIPFVQIELIEELLA